MSLDWDFKSNFIIFLITSMLCGFILIFESGFILLFECGFILLFEGGFILLFELTETLSNNHTSSIAFAFEPHITAVCC